MSKNSLSGPIPLCLIEWGETLAVLNLGKNRLSGNLCGTFQENCGLETLDFHENQLEGKIPESISNCTSLECPGVSKSWPPNLQIINIASNNFSGALIPKCFLKQKAMMDDPEPEELASITFLSALNLSYNKLTGKIPSGNQFTIFAQTSFDGNEGLCGPQLNKSCSHIAETLPPFKDKHSHPEDGKKWELLSAASVGYVVGLGFVIGPLFFCERWSKCTGSILIMLFCGLSIGKAMEAKIIKEKPTRNQFKDVKVRA
ncbi:hypothetical protein LguiA_026018 [Lonicera macranthoides]